MKCTHCHNNEANTHIKRTINGKTQEMYLCEDCARELGVMDEFKIDPFGVDSFFGNLLGAGVSALNSITGIGRCPDCGTSLSDIVNTGRVGCANCYSEFESELAPTVEKLHGKAKHVGKFVTYTVDEDSPQPHSEMKKESEVDKLKEDLKLAVKEQRFEDAAVIRDKIKNLTQEG